MPNDITEALDMSHIQRPRVRSGILIVDVGRHKVKYNWYNVIEEL